MIYIMSGYSIFMFVAFLLSFFISLILFIFKESIMFEWAIFSSMTFMIEIYILVDWISMIFMGFVLLISSMILIYSVEYMSGVSVIMCFVYLIIMFIVSMLMMILSPSVVSIMFGWDLLGLVSFCLVIFYQNYSSMNSGMVTVLTNRIGDIGLLMAIGMILTYGSWNLYFLEDQVKIALMLLVAAITKSAQLPFSTWLPMAMAAPTPVSSLVHSSTLVTAGIYLIIRFNKFIMSSNVSGGMLFLSTTTMFMSGLMANYEVDLKKIIALSTLSQLGMMFMVLSLGMSFLGLFHLLTHAIFKSLLFMSAGVVIHLMKDNQDIRKFGGLNEILPFTLTVFMVALSALMGYPFLAGFYSKDLMVEVLYLCEVNIMIMLMIMFSMGFTVLYSFRVIYYVFFKSCSGGSLYFTEGCLMSVSMVLLCLMSVVVGASLSWMFFFDFSFIFLGKMLKSLISIIVVSAGGVWGLNHSVIYWTKIYKKKLMLFMVSMWFLGGVYKSFNWVMVYVSMKLDLCDDLWVEVHQSGFWLSANMFWSRVSGFMFSLQGAIFGVVALLYLVVLVSVL